MNKLCRSLSFNTQLFGWFVTGEDRKSFSGINDWAFSNNLT